MDDTIEFNWDDGKPTQYEEQLFQDWRSRKYPSADDKPTAYSLVDLFNAFQAGARSVLGLIP